MHAVLAQGAASPTHDDLARVAGVNRRTIANVIADVGAERMLSGRRPVRLGPGAGLVLSMSVGTETLRGALVDANGEMHHEIEYPTTIRQLEEPPGRVLARIRSLAARLLSGALSDEALWRAADIVELRLLGAVVAWPCPVDREKRPGGRVLRHADWRRRNAITGRLPTLTERVATTL